LSPQAASDAVSFSFGMKAVACGLCFFPKEATEKLRSTQKKIHLRAKQNMAEKHKDLLTIEEQKICGNPRFFIGENLRETSFPLFSPLQFVSICGISG